MKFFLALLFVLMLVLPDVKAQQEESQSDNLKKAIYFGSCIFNKEGRYWKSSIFDKSSYLHKSYLEQEIDRMLIEGKLDSSVIYDKEALKDLYQTHDTALYQLNDKEKIIYQREVNKLKLEEDSLRTLYYQSLKQKVPTFYKTLDSIEDDKNIVLKQICFAKEDKEILLLLEKFRDIHLQSEQIKKNASFISYIKDKHEKELNSFYQRLKKHETNRTNKLRVIIVCLILILIVSLISYWRIFQKAGKGGWEILIPFYSLTVFLEILKQNRLVNLPFILFIILIVKQIVADVTSRSTPEPIVNIVLWSSIILLNCFLRIILGKVFAKGIGFTIGLVTLPFIFLPILAFGKSKYQIIEEENNFLI